MCSVLVFTAPYVSRIEADSFIEPLLSSCYRKKCSGAFVLETAHQLCSPPKRLTTALQIAKSKTAEHQEAKSGVSGSLLLQDKITAKTVLACQYQPFPSLQIIVFLETCRLPGQRQGLT